MPEWTHREWELSALGALFLKPLLLMSIVVAITALVFFFTTRADSTPVVAFPELETQPARTAKQVDRAIPSEVAQPPKEQAAGTAPSISSIEEQDIDWAKIALDDTGETLGSRRSAFTAGFGSSLKESMRECIAQLPANHERKTFLIELRVRPTTDAVIVEDALLNPKELDAYMRKCFEGKIKGSRLAIEPIEELGTPKRVMFPLRF